MDLPNNPYDERMGFEVVDVEPGRVRLRADLDDMHCNPMGVLHGGVLSGIADSAMGLTMFSVLDAKDGCTNVDLNMRFLRGTSTGPVAAEGRIVKQGSRLSFLECDVTDGEGRLLARGTSTFMVLPGARA